MSICPAGKLDVVIPTCNRPRALRECLLALVGQVEHLATIFVVDDGSRSVREYCDGIPLPGLVILQSGGRGPCAARNLALEQVSAPHVGFLDDDSTPHPAWAFECLHLFDSYPSVTGQLGRIRWLGLQSGAQGALARRYRSFLPRYRQKIYDSRHRQYTDRAFRETFSEEYAAAIPHDLPGIARHLSGGNAAIRTSFLRDHGLLDQRFRTYHDRELAFRVLSHGGLIAYNPGMEVKHDHDPSVIRSLKRCIRAEPYQRLLDAAYRDPHWLASSSPENSVRSRHVTPIEDMGMTPAEWVYSRLYRLARWYARRSSPAPSDDPLASREASAL